VAVIEPSNTFNNDAANRYRLFALTILSQNSIHDPTTSSVLTSLAAVLQNRRVGTPPL
jgi:hypothetical protein